MQKADASKIGELEARLNKVGDAMETTLHEDQLLLMHIDRLTTHCKRTLNWMDKESKMHCGKGSNSDESTPLEAPWSRGSSTTDTTTCEKKLQPSFSISTNSSPDSLSALEAQELFPESPIPQGGAEASSSSESSRPSPRTHFVRRIAHAREQQVRAIMSDMHKRMQRGESA